MLALRQTRELKCTARWMWAKVKAGSQGKRISSKGLPSFKLLFIYNALPIQPFVEQTMARGPDVGACEKCSLRLPHPRPAPLNQDPHLTGSPGGRLSSTAVLWVRRPSLTAVTPATPQHVQKLYWLQV